MFRLWLERTGLTREPTDVDVTSSTPELREGVVPGTTYSLPDGLYIAKGTNRLFLDKPFPGESTPPVYNPKSRAEYEVDPNRWPEIISFLAPKATVRVGQVRRYTCFAYSKVYVIGVVTDGEKTYTDVHWDWPKPNPPLRQE